MVSASARAPCAPASTSLSPVLTNALISLEVLALACASSRTSLATTANPAPFSPARAASTAALRARRLVRNATSSMPATSLSILPTNPVTAATRSLVSSAVALAVSTSARSPLAPSALRPASDWPASSSLRAVSIWVRASSAERVSVCAASRQISTSAPTFSSRSRARRCMSSAVSRSASMPSICRANPEIRAARPSLAPSSVIGAPCAKASSLSAAMSSVASPALTSSSSGTSSAISAAIR